MIWIPNTKQSKSRKFFGYYQSVKTIKDIEWAVAIHKETINGVCKCKAFPGEARRC